MTAAASKEEKSALVSARAANVKTYMYHSFFFGMFDSVCREGGIFDNFLFLLSDHSNATVGSAETLCGLSELVCAVAAGILADWYHNSRSRLLKRYAALGVLVGLFFATSVWLRSVRGLLVSLVLYGAWVAFKNCTAMALFADSAPANDEGVSMVRAEIAGQCATAVGPLLTILVLRFLLREDEWTMHALQPVLVLGGLGLLIPAAFLWPWTDVPHRAHKNLHGKKSEDPGASEGEHTPQDRTLPFLLTAVDLVTQLGMGMTVKFVPLFYKEVYDLHPVAIEYIYVANAVVFGLVTFGCRFLAGKIGRIRACVLYALIGGLCLLGFSYTENLNLSVVFFILRGAFANAVVPLDRSLVLDCVPSKERGRWAAAESLGSMSWSGSAFIGGYLIDKSNGNYRFCFKITTLVYCLAFCIRLYILRFAKTSTSVHKADEPFKGTELTSPV